jgi:hypothetical protein
MQTVATAPWPGNVRHTLRKGILRTLVRGEFGKATSKGESPQHEAGKIAREGSLNNSREQLAAIAGKGGEIAINGLENQSSLCWRSLLQIGLVYINALMIQRDLTEPGLDATHVAR